MNSIVDQLLRRRYYALLLVILNENFTPDTAMAYMSAKDTRTKRKGLAGTAIPNETSKQYAT
ncbi:MAG: hypothetical protein IJ510_01670 [Selenomonadales bacterium]|nr:hypothetical protein [Selenomonadales bacterium]